MFSFSYKDGVEIAEDARVGVNRDRAPHGSYELVIHKVTRLISLPLSLQPE